ncbi:glutamate receptor-like protein, partial [Dinothrombium tinctorium]
SCCSGWSLWDNSNTHLVVTSILQEPFLMKVKTESAVKLEGNDRYEGYCKDLADLVASALNVTYTIKLVNDSRYGAIDRNSSTGWNGMVHELINGDADVAIAPLTITESRARVLEFTTPFMTTGLGAIIKRMPQSTSGFLMIFAPLSFGVWLSVIAVYLLFAAILYLISTYTTLENLTIFECFWLPIQHMTLQRLEMSPKSKSTRALLTIWWFFIIIVLANYLLSLNQFMTESEHQLTEVDDLLRYSDVEYGVLKYSSSYEFFQRSKKAAEARMWEYMVQNPHVFTETVAEGIERVRESDGKYALFVNSATIEYLNEREPCDTMKVGENLNEEGFGIATRQNSKLASRLNIAVLQLKESGLLFTLRNKWWFDRSQCNSYPEEEGHKHITLSKLSGLYFVILLGLFIVAALYSFEFYLRKKEHEKAIEQEQNNVHKRQGEDVIPLT